MRGHVYSPEVRATAVARASVIGDKAAALELGIPRRTVSHWHSSGEYALIAQQAAESLVDVYADEERRALQRVHDALEDPETDARDLSRILDVLARNRALLAGQATARSENLNLNVSPLDALTFEERDHLRDIIDATLASSDVEQALVTLPDPTADLDRTAIFGLIAAIERRLDRGR